MNIVAIFSCLIAVATAQLGGFLRPAKLLNTPLNSIGHVISNSLESVSLGPLSPFKELAQQVTNCALINKWTDPYLGLVTHDNDYCDSRCSRFIPRVTCCSPSPPKSINATFKLFQRDGFQLNMTWDDVNSEWAKEAGSGYQSLVIVTHGFIEKVKYGNWLYEVKDGYLKRGVDAVIILDWDSGNGVDYFGALASVRTVGMMMAKLIVEWNLVDKTLAIGFSLGGQTVGEAGKYVQELTGGRKIKECHGLDPAGPFFDGCGPKMVLDKSDCELVQVIHTSAEKSKTLGPFGGSFGTYQKSGHCDYWVNCGFHQKPCDANGLGNAVQNYAQMPTSFAALSNVFSSAKNATSSYTCHHDTARQVYIAQLTGDCQFDAQFCPDCGQSATCSQNGPSVGFDMVPDSGCDPSMDVNFYIKTKQSFADGRYC